MQILRITFLRLVTNSTETFSVYLNLQLLTLLDNICDLAPLSRCMHSFNLLKCMHSFNTCNENVEMLRLVAYNFVKHVIENDVPLNI